MTKGIFCVTEHPAQSINWGELAGSHGSLFRDRLGIGLWAGSNCVVNQLFLLCVIPLSFLFITSIIIYILCQLLNCSCRNPQGLLVLSNSFCREEVGSEQTAALYLVTSWGSVMPVVSLFYICLGSVVYVFRLGICSARMHVLVV